MDFESFKLKFQKKPVEHFSNNVVDRPVVSVCVQTYRHAKYIKGCLDGILMQQTDFSFEILLGEDESTDGTREICIEYAKKHPDKIRLFLHKRENNIFINGTPTGRFNFLYNLYSSRGQYLAICEGDDYWTDPLKLQKQVAFLEENLEYTICGHPVQVIDDFGHKLYIRPDPLPSDISHANLLKENFLTTCSVVFKKIQLTNPQKKLMFKIKFGDWPLFLFCAEKGKIGFLDMISANYRKHLGGTWSTSTSIKQQKAVLDFYKLYDEYTHGRFYRIIHAAQITAIKKMSLEYLVRKKIIFSFYYYLKWILFDKRNAIKITFFYFSKIKSIFTI